jgi:hypothetical protein
LAQKFASSSRLNRVDPCATETFHSRYTELGPERLLAVSGPGRKPQSRTVTVLPKRPGSTQKTAKSLLIRLRSWQHRLPGRLIAAEHLAQVEAPRARSEPFYLGSAKDCALEQIRNRVALGRWALRDWRSERRRERVERHGRSHAAVSDGSHSNPTRDHDLC